MNKQSAHVYAYPPLQQAWPADGKPLFREARSPYFLPVTEEILAEIVRRIVAAFNPEKIIVKYPYCLNVLRENCLLQRN